MGPVVCLAVFVGIVVFLIVYFARRQRRRQVAWQELATRLGFSYVEKDEHLPVEFSFQLFSYGKIRFGRNVLRGEREGVPVILGDYHFETPVAEDRHEHEQTISVVTAPGMSLPSTVLMREGKQEGFAAKLTAVVNATFGGGRPEDIDFDDDSAFSEAFTLHCSEQAQAREIFNSSLRKLLVRNRDLFSRCVIETAGDAILVIASSFRDGFPAELDVPVEGILSGCTILLPPEQSVSLMKPGLLLLEQWRGRGTPAKEGI